MLSLGLMDDSICCVSHIFSERLPGADLLSAISLGVEFWSADPP